jgi:methylase of polypeptide subunit release factors
MTVKMNFVTTGPNQYCIQYDRLMDGGGTEFGQEYIEVIKQRYPKRVFERCYEWCSGPAFIGFSILDHGICNSLCVSDIYYSVIDQVKETVKINNLKCVSSYVTGNVSELPKHEMFDLIVANPPHFSEYPNHPQLLNHPDYITNHIKRLAVDQDWKIHQEFFANIGKHLMPGGIILLQENHAGSLNKEKDF